MAECLQILEVCKTASERQDYSFNLTREFSRLYELGRPYPANDRVRPNARPGIGLQFVSSGGVANEKKEPTWAATGPIADGSIVWTPEVMSFAGLKHRIDTVVWPSDPMLSDQFQIDEVALQECGIWVSGGVAGTTNTFRAQITTTIGAIFEVRLVVTIEP